MIIYIIVVFSFFIMSILFDPQKRIIILGDYSGEVHLFPFRTEKLSPPAQMVLH